jgi:hypothetical protein
MAISPALRRKLTKAVEHQTLVHVLRKLKFAPGHLEGFVLQVGRRWALLAQTADGGWPNGYVAFRLNDVSSIRKDTGVSTTFAKTRPEWPPAVPSDYLVDRAFDNVANVVRTLGGDGAIFGIEKEARRSAMWIGVFDGVSAKWLWLREVDPKGEWAMKSLGYKLKSITAVTTGDRYMRVLESVAGEPPEPAATAHG